MSYLTMSMCLLKDIVFIRARIAAQFLSYTRLASSVHIITVQLIIYSKWQTANMETLLMHSQKRQWLSSGGNVRTL